jgi:hypothetical protein
MGLLSLIPVIGDLIDKVIPDPQKKMEYQIELQKLADQEAQREHTEMLGQIDVNKIEASHRSLFVAGWRPFIGWVGGVGLATTYIVIPIINTVQGKPLTLDMSELLVLLGGLLGFGGMRSFDKLKSNDVPLGKITPAAKPVQKQAKELRVLPLDIPGM